MSLTQISPVLSAICVGLYNNAILKIFPVDTMKELFGENLESITGDWRMKIIEKNIGNYPNCATRNSDDEYECNQLKQEKDFFLLFIQTNFPELNTTTAAADENLKYIKKQVKKFIQNMEVKTDLTRPAPNLIQIDVVLHDIIGSLNAISHGSLDCISEKLFLAILLAIKKKVNVFSVRCNLTFKFSKGNLFSKSSGLQRSSAICSQDKNISESTDPVSANEMKTIFRLDVTDLIQAENDYKSSNAQALLAQQTAEEAKAGYLKANADLAKEAAEKQAVAVAEAQAAEKANTQRAEKNYDNVQLPPKIKTQETYVSETEVSKGGSNSRRRHRRHRKLARKTRRGRGRGRSRKSKTKTHRRRRHSRGRKHKKNLYTRRR